MTRKRFVRLMMAKGMQRNKAAELAARVGAYGSYEALYGIERFRVTVRIKIAGVREFKAALMKVGQAARELGESLARALPHYRVEKGATQDEATNGNYTRSETFGG